jgi:predicted dehydrogenase
MNTLPTGLPVVGRKPEKEFREPKDRLGVGVVGLHEGRTLLVALQEATLARAVAGCDLREEKIAEARAVAPDLFYTRDYAEMLKRPEVQIVAIYTPDHVHHEQIEAAFRAGKDVICTKPLINTVEAAPRLLAVQKETRRRLQVGQSTRFFEPFRRQRACFERGDIGRVEVIDAHYNHRMHWFYEKSPWAIADTDWAFAGLSHPLDLVRWYLGRIDEVSAYGMRTALGRKYGVKGFDAYVVNLLAADGRIGRVLGNYGVTELPQARSMIECWLMGERGSSVAKYPELEFIRLDDDHTEVREDYHHELYGYHFRHELKGMHYGEFCNYADYFAGAILHGTPNSPDLEEGIETVCVMEATRESAQTGKPVKLGPLLEKAGIGGG